MNARALSLFGLIVSLLFFAGCGGKPHIQASSSAVTTTTAAVASNASSVDACNAFNAIWTDQAQGAIPVLAQIRIASMKANQAASPTLQTKGVSSAATYLDYVSTIQQYARIEQQVAFNTPEDELRSATSAPEQAMNGYFKSDVSFESDLSAVQAACTDAGVELSPSPTQVRLEDMPEFGQMMLLHQRLYGGG